MCLHRCRHAERWRVTFINQQINIMKNEIEINGDAYVKKDSIKCLAKEKDGLKYVLVRTYSAGVHVGFLKERNVKEVTLLNARRIWSWSGAASLSQLAVDGTSQPDQCKFPCEVSEILLTEAIEVIPMTEKAKKSIEEVSIWKQ